MRQGPARWPTVLIAAVLVGLGVLLWHSLDAWVKADHENAQRTNARRRDVRDLVDDVYARLDKVVFATSAALEKSAALARRAPYTTASLPYSRRQWDAAFEREIAVVAEPILLRTWLDVEVSRDQQHICERLGLSIVTPLTYAHSVASYAAVDLYLVRGATNWSVEEARGNTERMRDRAKKLRSSVLSFLSVTTEALADDALIGTRAFSGCDKDWAAESGALIRPGGG